ncbi:ATPase [Dysgonomonas sp. 520]|uniref:ATPase n=1 Tax=Dysgonomonas sp. 520 TaxID=2302931 RepID=UPI0013D79B12|nr:ATPase [Dysgonomonas sp. 520]NDW08947.1 ATPase [Dysgonomonas sp. 520]
MILLADSGSTKTDWCLVNEKWEVVKHVETKGLNPYYHSIDSIAYEIEMSLMSEIREYKINHVYFYGAGCEFDKKGDIRRAISLSVKCDSIEVDSDLVAAARALFGSQEGIACILGTGSSSCLFDGEKIIDTVPSLGYVLDDLGGGSALGKYFIRACFKKQMPEDVVDRFLLAYNMNIETVMDKVYRQPLPIRFLANVSPFLLENKDVPKINKLIKDCFREFFEYNIVKYDNYRDLNLAFTGSISYFYQDFLKDVAEEYGLTISRILKSPVEGLLAYHKKGI